MIFNYWVKRQKHAIIPLVINMQELFKQRMKNLLKDDYEAFMKALDQDSYKAIYLNPLKKEGYPLLKDFSLRKHPLVNTGYYYDEHIDPLGKLPLFQTGLYYIQEPSAMLVGELLHVQPHDKVLDMCGAPGGKTCFVASQLSQQGLMIANDISLLRAQILAENVERFGLKNTIVTSCDPVHFTQQFKGYFDKIILDAPCSGEGMIRKTNKAMETWSIDKIHECANIQKKLIDAAFQLLKKDGLLIYSTCTYEKEENEDTIQYALDHYPFHLIPLPHTHGMQEGIHMKEAIRLYPHHYQGEGHFIALLQKTKASQTDTVPLLKSHIQKDQHQLLQDFYHRYLHIPCPNHLYASQNHLYEIQPHFPSIQKIRILKTGLHLGECKKNRFEPSHDLALSLHEDMAKYTYSFSYQSEDIKKYLRGETLEGSKDKGYGLILVDHLPISFYKESNHQIKNLYPKGLRR